MSAGLPPRQSRAKKKWEVEKIVNKRRTSANKVEYLVVWKGFPGEDSWEGISNVAGCKDLINEFESALKQRGMQCAVVVILESIMQSAISMQSESNERWGK